MNQESNNLNQNNFNIQDKNGIPNNQPLQNNQGFNNTFNPNVGQNTDVSGPTFNPQPTVEPMQQPVQPQPIPSYEQPVMQKPTPQPVNPVESGNNSNQNSNSKPPKKINLGLIIGIVALVAVVGVGIVFGSKLLSNGGRDNNSTNGSNSNGVNNSVVKSNEIIKVESSNDGYETYMLDASGNIYATGFSLTDDFQKINIETDKKIIDITITDVGLLFQLENNEVYLVSNEIKSDKTINTSFKKGSAKRIMVDNISTINDMTTAVSSIQFLTKDGELYELVYNAYNEEASNVKKIMDNVKSVESNGHNVVILDKNGNGYAYGYNVSENGVLGTSDYSITSGGAKLYVSTPQKVGENLKHIGVASRSLMNSLSIFAINNNDELLIMGSANNNDLFMGQANNSINTFTKIYDDTVAIYPMMNESVIKTKDNKLISINTNIYNAKTTEIMSDVDNVFAPRGYGGILVLKDTTLYGYGYNSSSKFGNGESGNTIDTPIKIKDNVKRVFISKDYAGNSVFLIMKDGSLYVAGNNEKGALGIANQKVVKTFTEINY